MMDIPKTSYQEAFEKNAAALINILGMLSEDGQKAVIKEAASLLVEEADLQQGAKWKERGEWVKMGINETVKKNGGSKQ